MAEQRFSDWQCPAQASTEDRRLDWVNCANEEGQAWIRAQRGYGDWKKALDVISGRMAVNIPEYRSQLKTNHLKRNVREIVGTLSKLRPLWGYQSENPALKASANVMNLTSKAWYLETSADLSIKEALQYAAATCTGWIRPIYRRDMAGSGRGEIKLLSYGAPCVLPLQLPSSCDFQQAYAVTILDEMPIYMAHAMFPKFQDKLKPTTSQYWYSSDIRTSAKGNMWKRIFSFGRSSDAGDGISDLMVPIRYTYVIDLSLNKTGKTIPMGEYGTSWFYNVPSLDSDIPVGNGTFRKANANDARLYPFRRLIISSEQCIMYDGPSFDWHGRVPAIPFKLDSWAWEPLGFSIVRDGYDIQLSIDELLRGMNDKARAQNDLPLGYDINSVTSKEAKQFDPMQPRARVGFDGAALGGNKPFEPVVPPEVLRIFPEQLQLVDKYHEIMDSQHAVNDALALAKARMESDDIEKLLEASGPIIEDMSRSMEPPMRELGEQVKYLILQYYDTAKVLSYVGEDNMSVVTYDFDPESLVPSHLPGENVQKDSPTDRPRRARFVGQAMRFIISPRSIHELTQMQMKLGLIQLSKAGVMISSQTIAEAWNISNYGNLSGATEMEKWQSEQELKLGLAAKMQAYATGLQETAAMFGPSAIAPINPPGASVPGKPNVEGRPPSFEKPPHLEAKDGGVRGTIATS